VASLTATWRYYVSGQHIATRVGDELYYSAKPPFGTLPDPTAQSSQGSTSLTLANADGTPAGYVLYDGYGGVLTATLPATLTAQGVITDPDTGLVYLGEGRWYDPALGRPLQPNPAGGPPTVPQALNRYAATPLGQPGVAEGVIGYQPGVLEKGLFKTGLTYLVNQSRNALIANLTAEQPTGLVDVTVRGLRGSVPKSLRLVVTGETIEELTLSESYRALTTPGPLLARLFVAGRVARDLGRRLLGRETIWQTMEGRILESDLGSLGPDVEVLAATPVTKAALPGLPVFLLKHGIGLGWAVGLSFAIQYGFDLSNPYLTGSQRWARGGVAVIGGGILGYAPATGAAAAWGGPAGILVGFGWGLLWFGGIQPMIFKDAHFAPSRRLAPLH
jgi:hypothetical protein